MRTQRNIFGRQDGQAIIELALVFGILTTIMFGVLELSRAFYASCEVTNAARAGVQYAAVNYSSINLTSIQNAAVADAADLSGVTAVATEYCQCDSGTTVSCAGGTCASGAVRVYVKVVTTGQFNTLGKYPYIPKPINLNGSAILRVD